MSVQDSHRSGTAESPRLVVLAQVSFNLYYSNVKHTVFLSKSRFLAPGKKPGRRLESAGAIVC